MRQYSAIKGTLLCIYIYTTLKPPYSDNNFQGNKKKQTKASNRKSNNS